MTGAAARPEASTTRATARGGHTGDRPAPGGRHGEGCGQASGARSAPEVVHGGTDAGPAPRYDFSTNANALGPSPVVVDALRQVDPGAYPDPDYTGVRRALALAHGRRMGEVVVGAGASELIARIVAVRGGPVLILAPTFGEYRHAAESSGVELIATTEPDAYLDALSRASVAFLCQPNSPDGRVHEAAFVKAVSERAEAAGTVVACDLAYAPLSQPAVTVPHGAWEIHSPNKAHGATGLRAGYVLASEAAALRLRRRAPSWIVSAYGEALLRMAASDAGRAWVTDTSAILWRWRDELASALAERGMPITVGAANYLLVEVSGARGVVDGGPAGAVARDDPGASPGAGRPAAPGASAQAVAGHLAARGIRVRDATSFGLPRHLRLRAHAPDAVGALLDELDSLPGHLRPRPAPS